jgi:hypothetical protein
MENNREMDGRRDAESQDLPTERAVSRSAEHPDTRQSEGQEQGGCRDEAGVVAAQRHSLGDVDESVEKCEPDSCQPKSEVYTQGQKNGGEIHDPHAENIDYKNREGCERLSSASEDIV